jgi:hypothetical protein
MKKLKLVPSDKELYFKGYMMIKNWKPEYKDKYVLSVYEDGLFELVKAKFINKIVNKYHTRDDFMIYNITKDEKIYLLEDWEKDILSI